LGVGTAFLTAFYAFRLWFMTVRGEYRGHGHPRESPRVMTVPLMILAGFALVSGLLAYPMQGFGNLVFFDRADAGLPLVGIPVQRSEEHTSELQSRFDLVCRLLLEKKKQ